MPDLAEIIIDPVEEDVLEVVQAEVAPGEPRQVAVARQLLPGAGGSPRRDMQCASRRMVTDYCVPDEENAYGNRRRQPEWRAPSQPPDQVREQERRCGRTHRRHP